MRTGWLGATLGNTRQVPYRPGDDDGLQPPWPAVNPGVSAGEYLGDEWAHDPAVWGWFHADNPGRTAAQCGDALSRGKHFSWLVCSNRRLAVIVEADARHEVLQKTAEGRKADEQTGLLGGLLGKKGGSEQPRPIETWWEVPVRQVDRFVSAERGRTAIPVEFFGISFADHSMLEFRLENAPQLVETADQNLR